MMKFVYSSLLALTLLFPMTACGSNSEASISVPASSLSSEPAAEESSEPETANETQQAQSSEREEGTMENLRIRLSFEGNEVFVQLYDIPASRELLSRLPLTLEFQDFAGEEKISYLEEELPTNIHPDAPDVGDFTYYSPWGNLAIFYNHTASTDGGLIVLGNLESGRELLAGITGNFTMTIEQVTDEGGGDL